MQDGLEGNVQEPNETIENHSLKMKLIKKSRRAVRQEVSFFFLADDFEARLNDLLEALPFKCQSK